MKTKLLVLSSYFIPDWLFAVVLFRWKLGYWPRFKNPRSLNEKIGYIKLYDKRSLRRAVTDRVFVRDYVQSLAPECRLVQILWKGESLTEEIWKALPKRFVVKANHGSKMTRVVDKERESFSDIRRITNKWLRVDYYRKGRESVYRELERYLIVEEFLVGDEGAVPEDYKFFCFNGKVGFVQVDIGRFVEHRRNLYCENFIPIEGEYGYRNDGELAKPEGFEKAVRIAEKLSSEFDFIRVDLYIIAGEVFFGELTNTPENGFGRFSPSSLDFAFGARLKLAHQERDA